MLDKGIDRDLCRTALLEIQKTLMEDTARKMSCMIARPSLPAYLGEQVRVDRVRMIKIEVIVESEVNLLLSMLTVE